MLGRNAHIFIQVESGGFAPIQLHADELGIESLRGAPGGQTEDGRRFFADQAGDQPGGNGRGRFGGGLNDDFHST